MVSEWNLEDIRSKYLNEHNMPMYKKANKVLGDLILHRMNQGKSRWKYESRNYEDAARAYEWAGMPEKAKPIWEKAAICGEFDYPLNNSYEWIIKSGRAREVVEGLEKYKAHMHYNGVFFYLNLKKKLGDQDIQDFAEKLNEADSDLWNACCAAHCQKSRGLIPYFKSMGYDRLAEDIKKKISAKDARWIVHGRC